MNDLVVMQSLDETMRLGAVLAQSGFFEDSKQAAQAVVKILAGREIGIGPIAAMTGIHIVKGKPAIGANLIAAAIKRSGRYDYRIRRHDATVCEIEFFQAVAGKWESLGVSAFSLEDARRAGTQNLDKFARNMLFARAISNGARWYAPDIFGGGPVYTPDELGAEVDEDGEVTKLPATPVPTPVAAPEHWIYDDRTRKAFWAFVTRHGLSDTDLHAALGCEHVRDFSGTKEDAKALIEQYAAARVDVVAA